MGFIVIPKRKLRPSVAPGTLPVPVSLPVVVPPLILSGLTIDTHKNWAEYRLTNLGAPTDGDDAATLGIVIALGGD